MFDEPQEDPERKAASPADRAKDKSDEFRMHAELAAVFEACRKFDAQIDATLDPEIARTCQRTIGKLEKQRLPETPVLSEEAAKDAAELLDLPSSAGLATNDYHIYRRPGEVMILRWIEAEQVDSFYDRLQAHFDAALTHFREDERQALEWKQDEQTLAYLDALDRVEVKMAERYLREPLRQHKLYALSTQTADEMDILHLCDFVMGVPSPEIVGDASAPGEAPTEQERAWFFKLFSLRGTKAEAEQMFFFTYLQKSEEDWE